MTEQIDPAAEVVFETKIRYAGIHGYHHKNLGADLIKAGESKDITVLAVVPVMFESVYTNAFHPAYYIDSSKSEKMPFAFRTVQLPMLQPRSWATLLETGEPLREGGVGITAGNVKDHFEFRGHNTYFGKNALDMGIEFNSAPLLLNTGLLCRTSQ